jgi:hypothetical protein
MEKLSTLIASQRAIRKILGIRGKIEAKLCYSAKIP